MRAKEKRIIEGFISTMDDSVSSFSHRANVERDIKSYGFSEEGAHQFRVLVAAACLEGKAVTLRSMQDHIMVVHADLLPRKKEHRAKSLKLREETLEAFKTFLSKHDPERYKLFCKYESAAEWETVFYSEGDEDTW